MPLAVTLRLDDDAVTSLGPLHDALAVAGLADTPPLAYAPHLTLGVWDDDMMADDLLRAVAAMAPTWPTLTLRCVGFGVFPGPPAVLWVAPAPSGELLACHADLTAGCPGVARHSLPGMWTPHLTLAQTLADTAAAAAALAALGPVWRPFAARLDRAELVRFHPVERIATFALG